MRRPAIMILMTLMPLLSCARVLENEPIFGKYGFENQTSMEDFRQYVGKVVIYNPCRPLSYIEKNVFKTEKFVPGAEYKITNISIKSDRYYTKMNITITFKEIKGDKTLKMKALTDYANQFPFFFINDFNADVANYIGKKFTDPLVKGAYTIIDARIEDTNSGERVKEIVYHISNPEIKRYFKTTDYEMAIDKVLMEDKAGAYHSTLVKVEKPENTSERYSDVKTIYDKGVTKYSFEDNYISIIILGEDNQFDFKLDNKTQNSIKVVWDDAVFVDCNGSTSKIMHSGVKFNEREASQVASTIIRGATLEDIAVPISNVHFDEILKEWVTDTMYPKTISKGVKQFRLMLPIQIKDVVNEYVFVFDVEYKYEHPERIKNTAETPCAL